MGALTFCVSLLFIFLRLIVTCRLCIIYVRDDNNAANVDYMDPDVFCITMDEWPLPDLQQSRVFRQTEGWVNDWSHRPFSVGLCMWFVGGHSVCWRFGSRDPGLNSLRPRQNGRHFLDVILKRIFLNENVGISIKTSRKFVLKDQVNNISALVQIMAWRRPGDQPLSEPMMFNLLTHICVTRSQWVNLNRCHYTETHPTFEICHGICFIQLGQLF